MNRLTGGQIVSSVVIREEHPGRVSLEAKNEK